jgi:hypothetical protein
MDIAFPGDPQRDWAKNLPASRHLMIMVKWGSLNGARADLRTNGTINAIY